MLNNKQISVRSCTEVSSYALPPKHIDIVQNNRTVKLNLPEQNKAYQPTECPTL